MLCPWLKTITTSRPNYITHNGTAMNVDGEHMSITSEAFVPCQGSECPFYYTKKFSPHDVEQPHCRRSEIPREY